MIIRKTIHLCLFLILIMPACTSPLDQTEELTPEEPTIQPLSSEEIIEGADPIGTSIPSTSIPSPTQEIPLKLATDLVRGCNRNDGTDPELGENDPAVEFSLKDVDGSTIVLSELLKEKPVALIYGSYT